MKGILQETWVRGNKAKVLIDSKEYNAVEKVVPYLHPGYVDQGMNVKFGLNKDGEIDFIAPLDSMPSGKAESDKAANYSSADNAPDPAPNSAQDLEPHPEAKNIAELRQIYTQTMIERALIDMSKPKIVVSREETRSMAAYEPLKLSATIVFPIEGVDVLKAIDKGFDDLRDKITKQFEKEAVLRMEKK